MIRSFALYAALLLAPIGAMAQSDLLGAATKALGGLGSLGGVQGEMSPLAQGEIADGLRQALQVGTQRVVDQLGRAEGFNADPKFHIPLPAAFAQAQSALRMAGLSGMADDLELRLNRAAEAATPVAKDLFWQAIEGLTFQDVMQIYDGPDDAATQYLERTSGESLEKRMRPIVDESLRDAGAVAAYDELLGEYEALPFVPDLKADLTSHVLDYANEAIFSYLAVEEASIRQDPAKRTTELLQRVFGGQG